ncbi:hypothetical protein [Peterkaempfera bronchialis]|nr:hypothetical protein [Peterkaempfera bronchialis]
MDRIGPGTAVCITDYSTQPRELLRAMSSPIRRLKSTQQLPVVQLRRGWLHGSHLRVVVRAYPDRTAHLEEFLETAGRIAAERPGEPPAVEDYLRRAGQLARWENQKGDPLPLHPQGHVTAGPDEDAEQLAPDVLRARDLITAGYLEPVLDTAELPDAELLPTLARVMALVARSHPLGYGVGTLAFRSHVEGVCSATGNHADLGSVFAQRFAQDEEVFLDALTAPVDDPLLHSWQSAIGRGWGVAEGMCAAGLLDERALQSAVGPMEYPMGPPVRSEFIAAYLTNRQVAEQNYRQTAYRVLLNTVYPTLTCFGITPLRRYYLCFGLSEAADRLTGLSSVERMRARAGELAPR